MRRLRLAAAGLLALTLPEMALAHEMQCAPVADLTAHIEGTFGETSRGYGIVTGMPVLVEVFANAETGTWTVVVHQSNGLSCLLSSGEAWQEPAGKKGGGV